MFRVILALVFAAQAVAVEAQGVSAGLAGAQAVALANQIAQWHEKLVQVEERFQGQLGKYYQTQTPQDFPASGHGRELREILGPIERHAGLNRLTQAEDEELRSEAEELLRILGVLLGSRNGSGGTEKLVELDRILEEIRRLFEEGRQLQQAPALDFQERLARLDQQLSKKLEEFRALYLYPDRGIYPSLQQVLRLLSGIHGSVAKKLQELAQQEQELQQNLHQRLQSMAQGLSPELTGKLGRDLEGLAQAMDSENPEESRRALNNFFNRLRRKYEGDAEVQVFLNEAREFVAGSIEEGYRERETQGEGRVPGVMVREKPPSAEGERVLNSTCRGFLRRERLGALSLLGGPIGWMGAQDRLYACLGSGEPILPPEEVEQLNRRWGTRLEGEFRKVDASEFGAGVFYQIWRGGRLVAAVEEIGPDKFRIVEYENGEPVVRWLNIQGPSGWRVHRCGALLRSCRAYSGSFETPTGEVVRYRQGRAFEGNFGGLELQQGEIRRRKTEDGFIEEGRFGMALGGELVLVEGIARKAGSTAWFPVLQGVRLQKIVMDGEEVEFVNYARPGQDRFIYKNKGGTYIVSSRDLLRWLHGEFREIPSSAFEIVEGGRWTTHIEQAAQRVLGEVALRATNSYPYLSSPSDLEIRKAGAPVLEGAMVPVNLANQYVFEPVKRYAVDPLVELGVGVPVAFVTAAGHGIGCRLGNELSCEAHDEQLALATGLLVRNYMAAPENLERLEYAEGEGGLTPGTAEYARQVAEGGLFPAYQRKMEEGRLQGGGLTHGSPVGIAYSWSGLLGITADQSLGMVPFVFLSPAALPARLGAMGLIAEGRIAALNRVLNTYLQLSRIEKAVMTPVVAHFGITAAETNVEILDDIVHRDRWSGEEFRTRMEGRLTELIPTLGPLAMFKFGGRTNQDLTLRTQRLMQLDGWRRNGLIPEGEARPLMARVMSPEVKNPVFTYQNVVNGRIAGLNVVEAPPPVRFNLWQRLRAPVRNTLHKFGLPLGRSVDFDGRIEGRSSPMEFGRNTVGAAQAPREPGRIWDLSDSVQVKGGDGKIHEAMVSQVLADGRLELTWTEAGRTVHRELSVEQLERVETQAWKRFYEDVAASQLTSTKSDADHIEDALAVHPKAGVLGVWDGMGGHQGGDMASRIAKDAVLRALGLRGELRPRITSETTPEQAEAILFEAIEQAHQAVMEYSRLHGLQGPRAPGTTLSVGAVVRDPAGGRQYLITGNVGDSAIYIRRANADLIRATAEESPVAYAKDRFLEDLRGAFERSFEPSLGKEKAKEKAGEVAEKIKATEQIQPEHFDLPEVRSVLEKDYAVKQLLEEAGDKPINLEEYELMTGGYSSRAMVDNALGVEGFKLTREGSRPNVHKVELKPGDMVAAMTDGVLDNVPESRLREIFGASHTPEQLAKALEAEAVRVSRQYGKREELPGRPRTPVELRRLVREGRISEEEARDLAYAKPDDIAVAVLAVGKPSQSGGRLLARGEAMALLSSPRVLGEGTQGLRAWLVQVLPNRMLPFLARLGPRSPPESSARFWGFWNLYRARNIFSKSEIQEFQRVESEARDLFQMWLAETDLAARENLSHRLADLRDGLIEGPAEQEVFSERNEQRKELRREFADRINLGTQAIAIWNLPQFQRILKLPLPKAEMERMLRIVALDRTNGNFEQAHLIADLLGSRMPDVAVEKLSLGEVFEAEFLLGGLPRTSASEGSRTLYAETRYLMSRSYHVYQEGGRRAREAGEFVRTGGAQILRRQMRDTCALVGCVLFADQVAQGKLKTKDFLGLALEQNPFFAGRSRNIPAGFQGLNHIQLRAVIGTLAERFGLRVTSVFLPDLVRFMEATGQPVVVGVDTGANPKTGEQTGHWLAVGNPFRFADPRSGRTEIVFETYDTNNPKGTVGYIDARTLGRLKHTMGIAVVDPAINPNPVLEGFSVSRGLSRGEAVHAPGTRGRELDIEVSGLNADGLGKVIQERLIRRLSPKIDLSKTGEMTLILMDRAVDGSINLVAIDKGSALKQTNLFGEIREVLSEVAPGLTFRSGLSTGEGTVIGFFENFPKVEIKGIEFGAGETSYTAQIRERHLRKDPDLLAEIVGQIRGDPKREGLDRLGIKSLYLEAEIPARGVVVPLRDLTDAQLRAFGYRRSAGNPDVLEPFRERARLPEWVDTSGKYGEGTVGSAQLPWYLRWMDGSSVRPTVERMLGGSLSLNQKRMAPEALAEHLGVSVIRLNESDLVYELRSPSTVRDSGNFSDVYRVRVGGKDAAVKVYKFFPEYPKQIREALGLRHEQNMYQAFLREVGALKILEGLGWGPKLYGVGDLGNGKLVMVMEEIIGDFPEVMLPRLSERTVREVTMPEMRRAIGDLTRAGYTLPDTQFFVTPEGHIRFIDLEKLVRISEAHPPLNPEDAVRLLWDVYRGGGVRAVRFLGE